MQNINPQERQEYWFKLVSEYLKSGQRQCDFCRQHKVADHQLRYWLERHRDKTESVKFVSVTCEYQSEIQEISHHSEPTPPRIFCTLELGNGRRLLIESLEAMGQINAILKAVI